MEILFIQHYLRKTYIITMFYKTIRHAIYIFKFKYNTLFDQIFVSNLPLHRRIHYKPNLNYENSGASKGLAKVE